MSELFPGRIETERLVLVHESPDDADVGERYRHRSTAATEPAAFEYVPVSPHETPRDATEAIEAQHERWREDVGATYVVRPKPPADGAGLPAGETELLVDWETRCAYFVIVLRKRFWGRGYSGERAAAFVRVAFDHLDLDCVAVSHVAENENSGRAIGRYVERFGGRREGRIRNETVIDGEPVDTVRYTISRGEYEDNDVSVAVDYDGSDP